VDYDLYFSDLRRSSASQIIPFFTGSTKSLTVAMWVQYTDNKEEGGIFFTLYSVRLDINYVPTLLQQFLSQSLIHFLFIYDASINIYF